MTHPPELTTGAPAGKRWTWHEARDAAVRHQKEGSR